MPTPAPGSGPAAPPPDPQHLVAAAAAEASRRPLRDYAEALRTLRDKGFSYREIAAWLAGRGVEADHNAVYRAIGGESPNPNPNLRPSRSRRGRPASPSAIPAPPSPPPPAFEEPTLLD